jgi:hypothetical protein
LFPDVESRRAWLRELLQFQKPCPWGDLTQGEAIERHPIFGPEIPEVPLRLEIGCGEYPDPGALELEFAPKIQKTILSDQFPSFLSNYILVDLERPETINLGGVRVNLITSYNVFTADYCGAFLSSDQERKAFEKIYDLLMPGGILAFAEKYLLQVDGRLLENLQFKKFQFGGRIDHQWEFFQKSFQHKNSVQTNILTKQIKKLK